MPARFVGAWQRAELRLDGAVADPDEDAEVLWLQAERWYADLRVPLVDPGGPVEAFAGPARWDDPQFTWEHHLDWLGTYPSDVGTFESDGAELVERGTFVSGDAVIEYEERWVRAGPDTDFVVARGAVGSGMAVLVEVGRHRLVLVDQRTDGGEFSVQRAERSGEGWSTTFARGVELGSIDVPMGAHAVVGAEIRIGPWTSTVTEVGDSPPRAQPPA